jgi:hypothetical protein
VNTEDEERIAAQVLDRIRGGPQKRMEDLAGKMHQYKSLPISAFIEDVRRFVLTGKQIDSFDEPPDLNRFWADYELLTGETVSPETKQNTPIECCA